MTKNQALAKILIALGDRLIRLGCEWLNWHVDITIMPDQPHKKRAKKAA